MVGRPRCEAIDYCHQQFIVLTMVHVLAKSRPNKMLPTPFSQAFATTGLIACSIHVLYFYIVQVIGD